MTSWMSLLPREGNDEERERKSEEVVEEQIFSSLSIIFDRLSFLFVFSLEVQVLNVSQNPKTLFTHFVI